MSDALIKIEGVTKSFGGAVKAVDDIDLEIGRGEFFALLGPSGCGKTTLLRLIAGLEAPDSGRILIDGMDMSAVPPWHRPVNTVFQSYALFPHMTVADNIAFGLKQDRLPKSDIRDRVAEMLDLLELRTFANRKPDKLSGGQRQRVALARSLAKRPKALLLDEPLAALDRKLRDQVQIELSALQRRLGIAFIFVTHDQDEAMTMATRIALMRSGKLEQVGAPQEVYERPGSSYVADFFGRANILPGRIAGRNGALLRVQSPIPGLTFQAPHSGELAEGTGVWIAVRPENVTFEEHGHPNRANGIVREATYAGDVSRYEIDIGSGLVLRVSIPNRIGESNSRPERNAKVCVSWPNAAGILLTR
ncbi:MAG TPA: ABC transporter ATP-binding protein [Xanthobacteraceae bacterium]|jgi:putrescine transport system ATP-binding protein|nr:ABC transporter ATP-binding protein [Xanthobacteraceae bacterium]